MEIKKIKSKKVLNVSLVLTMFVILSSFVSANFGVGSPVSENLYPGQTMESAFTLQNTLDNAEEMVIKGSILEGEGYIAFINDVSNINVPAGAVVSVPIRISVPSNADIGDVYEVKAFFETVSGKSEGEGGMVEFKFNVQKSFSINVIENPAEPVAPVVEPAKERAAAGTVWLWIIAAIVLIIIVWWIIAASKKKKGGEGMQMQKQQKMK